MRRIDLLPSTVPTIIVPDEHTAEFRFALSAADQQTDVAYFDRLDEVHVNLALGRLCAIGCRECSATLISRAPGRPLRGSLSAPSIRRKVYAIGAYLAPRLQQRKLAISTMNDDDPLARPVDELAAVIGAIFQGCAEVPIALDRLNLSSSLVPLKGETVIALADRYDEICGCRLVQLQASLLATPVKQNIFAGDGRHLDTMVETLGYYHRRMRAAARRGAVWINYVAVKRGDFGRADRADHLDGIAIVAEALLRHNPAVTLKVTRGSVDGLDGWQPLDMREYARFVQAVQQRWGGQLAIYCPDLSDTLATSYHCGRIQSLGAAPVTETLGLVA